MKVVLHGFFFHSASEICPHALDAKLLEADSDAWCGFQVIDLSKRKVVAWFRIDGAVQEMFDVAVLPSVGCGMSVGINTDDIKSLITYAQL